MTNVLFLQQKNTSKSIFILYINELYNEKSKPNILNKCDNYQHYAQMKTKGELALNHSQCFSSPPASTFIQRPLATIPGTHHGTKMKYILFSPATVNGHMYKTKNNQKYCQKIKKT